MLCRDCHQPLTPGTEKALSGETQSVQISTVTHSWVCEVTGNEHVSDDDDFNEYAERVINDLVPKLSASIATISLVPKGPSDVKFGIELGLSIMMDLPIIAIVTPGVQVPAKLVQVADALIEGDISTDEGRQLLAERIQAELRRLDTK